MSNGQLAYFDIVNPVLGTALIGAQENDFVIRTDGSNQKIFLGTGSNVVPSIVISHSNVGIGGQSNPQFSLDVAGDVNFTGALYQNNAKYIGSQWSTNATSNSISITDSNVGIGTTNPAYSLDVAGDINFTGALFQNSSKYIGSQWNTSALSNSISITDSNVGIGTSNPAFRLDVDGDINFTGALFQNNAKYIGSQWTSANSNSISIVGSNVGIGTSNPEQQLHVAGNTRFDGDVLFMTNKYMNLARLKILQTQVAGSVANITSVVNTIGAFNASSADSIDFSLSNTQTHFRFLDSAGNVEASISSQGDINFAGQVLASNGTITKPSYSFSNAKDTGIYASSNTQLDLVVASSNALSIKTRPVLTSYPPSPLTSNNTTLSDGTYIATASHYSFQPYHAFDNSISEVWTPMISYDITTGDYQGSIQNPLGYYGEWIQLQLPNEIMLTGYKITCIGLGLRNFTLIGSVDGTTWETVDNKVNTPWSWAETKTFDVTTTNEYSIFRLIINAVQQSEYSGSMTTAAISRIQFIGSGDKITRTEIKGELDISGDINFSGSLTKNGIPFQSGVPGLSNTISNVIVQSGSNLLVQSGRILVPNGSQTSPSYSFSSASTTGMHASNNSQLSLVVGSSNMLSCIYIPPQEILFPPSALTGNVTTLSDGDYTVTNASDFTVQPYIVFDDNINTEWLTPMTYNITSGVYEGLGEAVIGYSGEWVQLQSPKSFIVTGYIISCGFNHGKPTSFALLGSKDGISWNVIDDRNNMIWFGMEELIMLSSPSQNEYTYFRFVITTINAGGIYASAGLASLKFLGTFPSTKKTIVDNKLEVVGDIDFSGSLTRNGIPYGVPGLSNTLSNVIVQSGSNLLVQNGQILVPNGSPSQLSLSFYNASNIGIYSSNEYQLNVVVRDLDILSCKHLPLLAYPPSPMTGEITNIQNQVYISSASGILFNAYSYYAFDNNPNTYWAPPGLYNFYGDYVGTTMTPPGFSGEWLQITIPDLIYVESYDISCPNVGLRTFALVGSSDNTTWEVIDYKDNIQWNAGLTKTFSVTPSKKFSSFRLIVTAIQFGMANTTAIAEFRIFGFMQKGGAETKINSMLDVAGDVNFSGSLTRNGVPYQSGVPGLSNTLSNVIVQSGSNLLVQSGRILVPNGSQTSPSYSFSNAPTTGLYAPNNTQLSLVVGSNNMLSCIYSPPIGGSVVPPSPLTGAITTLSDGDYIVTASGSDLYNSPINAFDNVANSQWITAEFYNMSTGVYEGTAQTVDFPGEWIQLQIPTPLVISNYTITCGYLRATPRSFALLGSKDGTLWQVIDIRTDLYWETSQHETFIPSTVMTQNEYSYFRLVITSINSNWILTQGSIENIVMTGSVPLTAKTVVDNKLDVIGDINFSGSLTRNGIPFQTGTPGLSNSMSNVIVKSASNLIMESGQILVSNGSETQPSYSFSNAKHTGIYSSNPSTHLGFVINSNNLISCTFVPPQIQLSPPSPMTSNTTTLLDGAYIASFSAGMYSSEPYHVFDELEGTYWTSQAVYNNSTGSYNGSTQSPLDYNGEWIQLEVPAPFMISEYRITATSLAGGVPRNFVLIGSSTYGMTWELIDNRTDAQWFVTPGSGFQQNTFKVSTVSAYTHFRLIFTAMQGGGMFPNIMISEFKLINASTSFKHTIMYGNVGIGADNPYNPLDVNGRIRAYTSNNSDLLFYATNTGQGENSIAGFQCLNDQGAGLIMFQNSSTRNFEGGNNTATVRSDLGDLRLQGKGGYNNSTGITIKQDTGRVGIGTSNPGTLLDVRGTLTASNISVQNKINNVDIRSVDRRASTLQVASYLADTATNAWTTTSVAAYCYGVCWSPDLGIFVSVGNTGDIIRSQTGFFWTTSGTFAGYILYDVCWSSDLKLFVAVGNRIIRSSDGINWTEALNNSKTYLSVCWSSELSLFVAVATSGSAGSAGPLIITSSDGITWTERGTFFDYISSWRRVIWIAQRGIFVASGTLIPVATSSDGITWTFPIATEQDWAGLAWSPELSLIVALSPVSGNLMTSPDGVNWTLRTSVINNSWNHLIWCSELQIFIAIASSGTGNRIMTSTDGLTWTTKATTGMDFDYTGISWSPQLGMFVGVATNSRVIYSTNIVSPGSGNLVMGRLGIAPVSRGGTGAISLTANKLLVGNGTSNVLQPNELHWDTATTRLGINTTTPTQALDVNGNIRLFRNVDSFAICYATNTSATTGAFSGFQCFNDVGTGLIMFQNSSARTSDGGVKTATVRNDQGDLRLQANGQVGMHIKETTGRIGIGTSDPQASLDVFGNVRSFSNADASLSNTIYNMSSGANARSSIICWNNTGGGVSLFINSSGRTADGGASTATLRNDQGDLRLQASGSVGLHVKSSTGRIGIGTAAPASILDVYGTISTAGTARLDNSGNLINVTLSDTSVNMSANRITSGMLAVDRGGTGATTLTANKLLVGNGTNTIIQPNALHWDNANTRLGINTLSPSYTLHVTGEIYATGDIGAFSDARVKSDVKIVTDALSKLKQISGYTFNRTDRSDAPDPNRRYMGLIAQEVEKIAPEVIYENNEGYKGIAYQNMAALFVEAIKELSEKIDSIQSRING